MPQSSAFMAVPGCQGPRLLHYSIFELQIHWDGKKKGGGYGPMESEPQAEVHLDHSSHMDLKSEDVLKLKVRTVRVPLCHMTSYLTCLTWKSWMTNRDPMAKWGPASASLSCRQSAAAGGAFSLASCGSIKLISWSMKNFLITSDHNFLLSSMIRACDQLILQL